ncbi:MAG: low molecular weight protein arginine phosphatase [Clostridiales bacterium]|nr:low molecular weight protein arginine phosphatase [Clostridiales bacterium]
MMYNLNMKKILFVCNANTCRSPMAVSILKSRINKTNLKNKLIIHSAGISAKNNMPMNDNAIKALKTFSVPVSKHSSMLLDEKSIVESDIVITMTNEQKEFLSNYKNVYSIKELTGVEDILDPFGEGFEVYLKVCKNLIKSMDILTNKMVEKDDIYSK